MPVTVMPDDMCQSVTFNFAHNLVTFSVPQMFFYNVNMLPSELFDESISIRVRTDTTIIYILFVKFKVAA